MAMAEDSRKVARIADGSAAHLSDMYSPAHLTRDFAHVGLTADADGAWARDASRTSTLSLLAALPSVRCRFSCCCPVHSSHCSRDRPGLHVCLLLRT